MTSELAAAQGDLSANLIELRNSPNADAAAIAQGDQQLAMVLALKQKLALAGPGAIGTMSAEIAGVIASAAAVTRVIQAAASNVGGAGSLAAAVRAAREAVNDFADDYFGKRKFDPYLVFASEQEQREFREREATRQKQIDAARAEGTPEGDRRALQLSISQLKDAGAHGADKSPDYAPLLKRLESNDAELATQLNPTKRETKSATISAPDPLDGPTPDAPVPLDLLAKFKSAGVVVADQSGKGHGVNAGTGPQSQGPRLPS